jgi:hypothetical protein
MRARKKRIGSEMLGIMIAINESAAIETTNTRIT